MMYPICPKCRVRVPAVRSERVGNSQVRNHECKCGFKVTKAVPVDQIWSRKRYESAQAPAVPPVNG